MISPQHISLATRLALSYTAVIALCFGVAGVHLYRSTSEQLRLRDDAALLSSIDFLRHQLTEFENLDALRTNPHRLLDIVYGHTGLALAIRDSKGDLITTSSPDAALLTTDSRVAVDRSPDSSAISDWHGSDGKRRRVIAVWGRIGRESGDHVLLTVAREDLESGIVLAAHRQHLLLTVVAAVLAAAFLGYAMTRRGLRSVRKIAQTAGTITANQLSERLRVEDAPAELEVMVRAFNHMLDRLEDGFRRLTQFSSDIAHDLRTPIGNLMIGTQVALTRRRSIPEYETLLASSVEEYERMNRMVESMLFLARADNAQVALHKETISVALELQRIVKYFEGMAAEKDVLLDVDASGALLADADLFRRAVSNLIANALRHTPRGQQVTIRAREQAPDTFVVTVLNPGSGIPPEHLARIFDRFYRVEDARGESRSSSGLGLAIVKSIIDLHGGDVRVESAPNGLTTFSLVFPIS